VNWDEEKAAKRAARQQKQLERAMASPISIGQSLSQNNQLLENLASVAIAVEAMESLLVEKEILGDNAVLDRMKALMEAKKAQIEAEQAQSQEKSRIISPV
jgi:hypothetical protein